MKTRFFLLPTFIFCLLFICPALGFGQNLVTISDPNFRNSLEFTAPFSSCMVGTTGNKQLDTLCAAGITGAVTLFTFSYDMESIEEIKYFKNITKISISIEHLKKADLRNNKLLTHVEITGCHYLDTLNLSGLSALTNIHVENSDYLRRVIVDNCVALKNIFIWKSQVDTIDLTTNPALDSVTIYQNYLQAIYFTPNSTLKYLNLSNNALATIDISPNSALETLYIQGVQGSLDVSQNTALITLNCSQSFFTSSLDVSNNILLENLDISANINNAFTPIGLILGSKPWLKNLSCYDSKLTGLNVSQCPKLITLNCSNCWLNTLDVSANSNLKSLDCRYNQLTKFSGLLPNQLCQLEATGNSITCLPNIPNDCLAFASDVAQNGQGGYIVCPFQAACLKPIPDANFRAFLVQKYPNLMHGPAGSEQLDTCLAAYISEYLYCANQNISDLTGIEYFSSINGLDCSHNQLTNLDVSNNLLLGSFACNNNQLTELKFGNLNVLQCSYNQLDSLDLSLCPNLEVISCNFNQLTYLNLPQNPNMSNLECAGNQLTQLDVSNYPNLFLLNCAINQISDIDVSMCLQLSDFACYNNKLEFDDLETINSAQTIDDVPWWAQSRNELISPQDSVNAAQNITLLEGQTFTATTTVGGSANLYQWLRNNQPLSDGGNITGATTSVLQITNLSAADVGAYTCVVTSNYSSAVLSLADISLYRRCVNLKVSTASTVKFLIPQTNLSQNEGNSGNQTIPIWVELSGATTFPVFVKLPYSGTASYGNNFGKDFFFSTTAPTVVTWDATGVTLKFNQNTIRKFNLIIYSDGQVETDEIVGLTLTSVTPGVMVGGAPTRTFTILNDDVAPAPQFGTLTFAAATPSTSTTEGNSGTKLVPIQVTLSGANSFPVTAQIDYAGSTALFGNTFGKDFHLTGLNTSNQLVFTANGTKTFNIVVMGDVVFEADELVNLNLTSPTTGVILSSANRTVTILNDDAPRLGDNLTASESSLSLYPNPNNGLFNLSIESNAAAAAQVNVYDLNGRLVFSRQNELDQGQNLLEFDLTAEPAGLYLLEIQTGDRVERLKVVVK